jgi:hypothetical protein
LTVIPVAIGTIPPLRGNGHHTAIFRNFFEITLENDALARARSYAGILNISPPTLDFLAVT